MANPFTNARLRTVPQRKIVRIGGEELAETELLELYIGPQLEADISYLLTSITVDEIATQERLQNPPARIYVDGSPTRPLATAKRRTEVAFGNQLDLAMIGAIERGLYRSIKRFLPNRVPVGLWRWWSEWGRESIERIQGEWQWWYRGPTDNKYRLVNPRHQFAKEPFPIGGKLILRPRTAAVGFLNHMAKRRGRKSTSRRGRNKGETVTINTMGFMANAISALKRTRWMRDYTIYVTHTQKHMTPGDQQARIEKLWPYGTPYINIIAKTKLNQRGVRGSYRKY